jgi:hypothetical protein
MANLVQIFKQLQGERSRARKELERLDEAIIAFEKLLGVNSRGTVNKRAKRGRKLSAAARRKIARAQKARWAKLRQGAATKS